MIDVKYLERSIEFKGICANIAVSSTLKFVFAMAFMVGVVNIVKNIFEICVIIVNMFNFFLPKVY